MKNFYEYRNPGYTLYIEREQKYLQKSALESTHSA